MGCHHHRHRDYRRFGCPVHVGIIHSEGSRVCRRPVHRLSQPERWRVVRKNSVAAVTVTVDCYVNGILDWQKGKSAIVRVNGALGLDFRRRIGSTVAREDQVLSSGIMIGLLALNLKPRLFVDPVKKPKCWLFQSSCSSRQSETRRVVRIMKEKKGDAERKKKDMMNRW